MRTLFVIVSQTLKRILNRATLQNTLESIPNHVSISLCHEGLQIDFQRNSSGYMTQRSISHPSLLPCWCSDFFCVKQWNPFFKKISCRPPIFNPDKSGCEFSVFCQNSSINPFLKLKDTVHFPATPFSHPTCPISLLTLGLWENPIDPGL